MRALAALLVMVAAALVSSSAEGWAPAAPQKIENIAVTLIMSDNDTRQIPVHRAAYLDEFRHTLVLADTHNPTLGVKAAFPPANLGANRRTAQQKLEHALTRALLYFSEEDPAPSVDWFVFTETDTWWHPPSLVKFLGSADIKQVCIL